MQYKAARRAALTPHIDNVAASLRRQPRPLIVIYLYLPDAALLQQWPELRLRARWHRYHIYDWQGAAPAPSCN
ncbi:hypothetical protein [Rugamonas sp.]|uniref:hypothetical protein n=1 Tax=Rugamonas sp. TaxID=1926287 RepID=UPI0025F8C90C|nr:hypothetical protein [Rugamonas sp.]